MTALLRGCALAPSKVPLASPPASDASATSEPQMAMVKLPNSIKGAGPGGAAAGAAGAAVPNLVSSSNSSDADASRDGEPGVTLWSSWRSASKRATT